MHSLRGHHGAESTDVHGSLIGHDIGAGTMMAPRALSGPYEAQPSSPFSTGFGAVGNGATNVRRVSFAQFVNRSLDPGSGPNLFDRALRATAAAMAIDRTKEGHGGL
jgi:hypothetical protein